MESNNCGYEYKNRFDVTIYKDCDYDIVYVYDKALILGMTSKSKHNEIDDTVEKLIQKIRDIEDYRIEELTI